MTQLAIQVIEEGGVEIIEVLHEGPPGVHGDHGHSAYEIAVENGFEGTEEEWLASLAADLTHHLAEIDPHPQYAREFAFQQLTPSTSWTVNHNLGYMPAVAVFDSGSQQIDADVAHLSVNTVQLTFSIPTTGFTRLT